MIFKELTKIVADNNLIERSKETFWEVLKAYQEEDPEEFIENFDNYNKSNVSIEINNVSFLIHNWPSDDHCCVLVNVNIVYKDKVIGYYDIQYRLDGEIDNDLFVIY